MPLLLVRHSVPALDPSQPAREWPLSVEGRRRCDALAESLARHGPVHVYSSTERKALETAKLAARGVTVTAVEGLHEHDRENVPWLEREEVERSIRETFARPDDVVFGRESARTALARFDRAVSEIESTHSNDTVAVVSHGTVISLFVAARTGIDAYGFWRRLGLPALVVLEHGEARLEEVP